MRFAGIAGGVGTTVTATIMGGEDGGRDIATADVVVARNDYRCAKELSNKRDTVPDSAVILLIVGIDRTLTGDDFRTIMPGRVIIEIPENMAIARADDAGLLHLDSGAVGRFHTRLSMHLAHVLPNEPVHLREKGK